MAVSAVKVLPRWKLDPVPKTFGMRKNSYATKLIAAMMPMMLIFCTVNFVLVSAAISSARAATTNSSSHIVAVDIVSYTSIDIFLPGRYVFIILISGSE